MVASRSCGKCALCCRLMSVPEVKKNHEWCPFCKPGYNACTIYKDRPDPCRTWQCQWLIDNDLADYWKPQLSRIIVDAREDTAMELTMAPGTATGENQARVCFVVDPDYPLRWREEPWFSDIKSIARAGIEGRLGKKWTTFVLLKDEALPIVM